MLNKWIILNLILSAYLILGYAIKVGVYFSHPLVFNLWEIGSLLIMSAGPSALSSAQTEDKD